jgi:hypothetical protein
MAMTSPTFNSNGDVEIQYVNGSTCEEDPTQNYRSKITFKCKPGAFPGKPELGKSNVLSHSFLETSGHVGHVFRS